MSLRAGLVVATLVLLVIWILSDAVWAQVVTNITPTTIAPLDLGTNVDTVGSTTHITGGTRPGGGTNLFHSFDAFTLGSGDVAHFMNDMQLPTTNIFGRVIGGEVSTIDGTLRTNNPLNAADPMNFGAANLWLVNPSGLFLGPNVHLEVGGSVSMTTANYLRFEGAATLFDMFSAPASLGPLSVAPVVAFGFLSPELPTPITVQGSLLQVPEGQTLSLVGGGIALQAGMLEDGTMQAASLRAPSGQLNLVSVASPGEMLVPSFQTGVNITGASFTGMGTVMLKEGAGLDVSGQFDEFGTPIGNGNSGTVFVRGGQLVMEGSEIRAITVGAVDGAGTAVDIQVSQDVQLLNGAQVITATRGAGTGGAIDVQAESLLVSGVNLTNGSPSSLVSSTSGPGASGTAGNIQVVADSIIVQNGGQIRADLLDGSPGNAGNIDITAGTVDIINRGIIVASAVNGTGSAGNIDISANDVRITGVAGTVDPLGIDAILYYPDFLFGGRPPAVGTVDPFGVDATGITTSTNAGHGGELKLQADTLAITDNGAMTSRTIGSGDAGTIDLQIANDVTLTKGGIVSASTSGTGVGGNISVATDTMMLSDGGILSASTFGVVTEAAGGTIQVDATTVSLTGGSQIASDSFGPGDSGAIHITASDLVTLTGTSADGLTPSVVGANANATGNGGDIVVETKNLTASGGAFIRNESTGPDAGSIHIKATETVSLAGESANGLFGSGLYSGVLSSAPDAGDGGSIVVEAKNLTIGKGGVQIATFSGFGGADGGTIRVTVAETLTIAGTSADGVFASGLFANAEGSLPGSGGSMPASGKGGNIFVATKYLSVEGGGQISTISLGSGKGGDIRVTATELVMLNGRSPHGLWPSGVVANAESGASDAGDAGNIIVESKALIIENGAGINSASFGPGAGGNINVQASHMTMDSGATVSASSSGTGNAGTITINAGSEFLSTNSSVTTAATQASGGNITLLASDMVRLRNSQISASVLGGTQTAGGNITIDPQFVILQNSRVTANAVAGSGGAINVNAGVFLADPISVVDASSQQGPQGTVNIQSPVQNLSGQLTPLSQQFSSATALLAQQCAARAANGRFSTFVVAGREALPVEPGGFLASPTLTPEVFGLGLSGRDPHTPIAAVTGAFPEYDARPIQLAKFGDACHQ